MVVSQEAQKGILDAGSYHISLPLVPASSMTSLDPKKYPRDFKSIPLGTDYGTNNELTWNKEEEKGRLEFLAEQMGNTLKKVAEIREHATFTTALIAGDMVILDVLAKNNLLDKVQVVFVDTYHLFPETPLFMKEVEAHYGFKAKWYHAKSADTQAAFWEKHGADFWTHDIDAYDAECKVEPLKRSLAENNNDMWINGRRRDMGALRANLPIWEGGKLNPLAFWTFEDCWSYLRTHSVPYHPLHDVGFSSLGDMQSTKKVPLEKWMSYGGERSGRFQNLKNKDGTKKTECGIHTEIENKKKAAAAKELTEEEKAAKAKSHLEEAGKDFGVEIYTFPKCKYCNAVKHLMLTKGVKYKDYHMTVDVDWGTMQKRVMDCCAAEVKKQGKPEKLLVVVPQIFINGKWWGTHRSKKSLKRLEQTLDELVAGSTD